MFGKVLEGMDVVYKIENTPTKGVRAFQLFLSFFSPLFAGRQAGKGRRDRFERPHSGGDSVLRPQERRAIDGRPNPFRHFFLPPTCAHLCWS